MNFAKLQVSDFGQKLLATFNPFGTHYITILTSNQNTRNGNVDI